MKKKNIFKESKKVLEFTVFTGPAIILILLMSEIPFLMNFFYSFTKWNGIDKAVSFVGLSNFIELFTDDRGLIKAFIFTFKYAFFYVVASNVLGLFLAVVLDQKLKTRKLLRTVFFVPYILSMIVVGFMFIFIFNYGFQTMFELTKIEAFNWSWLGDANLAFISVVIVSIWQISGYFMVIYIAGLQSVPIDIIEAAQIDGASAIYRFFKITLPMIMPSITICMFLAISNALKVFDLIFVLTKGGPADATRSISLDIYLEAFRNNRYGYGTAKSVVFFLIVMLITVIQVKFFKGKEVEA